MGTSREKLRKGKEGRCQYGEKRLARGQSRGTLGVPRPKPKLGCHCVSCPCPSRPFSIAAKMRLKHKLRCVVTPLLKTPQWLPISVRMRPDSLIELTTPGMAGPGLHLGLTISSTLCTALHTPAAPKPDIASQKHQLSLAFTQYPILPPFSWLPPTYSSGLHVGTTSS